MKQLLNIRQAAQLLAVSVSTLYSWVSQRRIPFVKVGRSVRFDLNEMEEFIQLNRRAPRSEFPGQSDRIHHAADKG